MPLSRPPDSAHMPKISRRTAELGTENAFVVLAEVNELVRQGKDIISFCIGQPDFHTPVEHPGGGDPAIREGKHGYTPSAGITELREAAARDMGRMRGLSIDPEDVVIGAGAKPFIAYTILCDHRLRRRRRGDLPQSRAFRSTSRRSSPAARCRCRCTCARRATSPSIRPSSRRGSRRKTKLLILNSPHNPTGGILDAEGSGGRSPRSCAGIRRSGSIADEIYSRLVLRGRIRLDRVAARDVRAHHHFGRRLQDLGDDRLAHRLRLQSRCSRRSSCAG